MGARRPLQAVESYRLFFTDRGGHVLAATEFVCPDDHAARQAAEARRDGRAMELWSLDRVVEKYAATDRPERPI